MSEPIKDVTTAVRELGALPMPVGPEPQADEPIRTIEAALAALGPLPESQQPEHGPLWSLLDWSLWGAGMGDQFREALADRMIAAVPARGRAHAEQLMAEFIKRRQIEKTGVTVYQEQRDELERLRARVAELEADREASDREYETATARIAELEAGPALPWAHAMSDADLAGFLDHLVSAALDRWRTDSDGKAYPDRGTLAAIERACAAWRTPGQGYRSDDDAPDFYEPGHTYSAANGTDWKFRVDTVTTHPENGERTALGWRHFGGEWEPYAYHEDDWDVHQYVGHVDITGGAS